MEIVQFFLEYNNWIILSSLNLIKTSMNSKDIDLNNNILIARKNSLLKVSWYDIILKKSQTLNNKDKNIRTISKILIYYRKLFVQFSFFKQLPSNKNRFKKMKDELVSFRFSIISP